MTWFKSLGVGMLLAMLGGCIGVAEPDFAPPALSGVRHWVPAAGEDTAQAAQTALAALTRSVPATDSAPDVPSRQFRTLPRQPVWYALDIGPSADGALLVLELTHPSVSAADLFVAAPEGPQPVAHAGRRTPVEGRLLARFPATLALPASASGRTLLLRVDAPVPLRGEFRLQAHETWAQTSLWQLRLMTACYVLAALGALFALFQAVRWRSGPYALYFLLSITIGFAGMFLTGLGEGTVWPALAKWRGQLSAVLACAGSGLVLLLGERAFALDVRTPRFSWALRVFGLGAPAIGIAALALPLPQQQLVSHVAALVSIVLGLTCIGLAWRMANRPALWLLAGFTPVIVGVVVTILGISTRLPFTPWMLMAMPLASLLEVPFNLYGLILLERRRQRVHHSLQAIAGKSGADDESRPAVLARLARPVHPRATASLMLLRLEGLAPGTPNLLTLDAVEVERFMHAMMAAAVRPGNRVGRWSLHEIAIRNAHRQPEAEIDSLCTALFAQALRCGRYGLSPQMLRLRIAFGRTDGQTPPQAAWLERLADALDDPELARRRKIEWDVHTHRRVSLDPASRP